MEVAAESLSEACEFAMEHADDGPNWEDKLDSSSHWLVQRRVHWIHGSLPGSSWQSSPFLDARVEPAHDPGESSVRAGALEAVDHSMALVPEEFSAEAIRLGGAELVVRRLRGALQSLIQACEQDPKTLSAVGGDVERAKAVLGDTRM